MNNKFFSKEDFLLAVRIFMIVLLLVCGIRLTKAEERNNIVEKVKKIIYPETIQKKVLGIQEIVIKKSIIDESEKTEKLGESEVGLDLKPEKKVKPDLGSRSSIPVKKKEPDLEIKEPKPEKEIIEEEVSLEELEESEEELFSEDPAFRITLELEELNATELEVGGTYPDFFEVMRNPGLDGEIIAWVVPQEVLKFVKSRKIKNDDDSETTWYLIIINDNQQGWLAEKYVNIIK